jgi:putative SOS response-associated peptidase YedK
MVWHPRRFHSGPRLNFEFNPNVAPTELVPALVAGEDVVLARFGINRLGSADKPRPPLLNVRTDGMRKGQFRKHLKERRCVIPCEGSMNGAMKEASSPITSAALADDKVDAWLNLSN